MKSIKIPFKSVFKSTLDSTNSQCNLNKTLIEEEKIYRKRAQEVVQSSLDLEEWVKELISKLLFNKDILHCEFMKELFLDSDFCMFYSKIKILCSTLKYLNLLDVKSIAEIEYVLSKVSRLRNAFAHGKICCENDIFYISYFQVSIRKKELNDDYWCDVETVLTKAHAMMDNLENRINQK